MGVEPVIVFLILLSDEAAQVVVITAQVSEPRLVLHFPDVDIPKLLSSDFLAFLLRVFTLMRLLARGTEVEGFEAFEPAIGAAAPALSGHAFAMQEPQVQALLFDFSHTLPHSYFAFAPKFILSRVEYLETLTAQLIYFTFIREEFVLLKVVFANVFFDCL